MFAAWKSIEAESGVNSGLYARGIWVWPCDLVLRSGKFHSMASSLLPFSPTSLTPFSREKMEFAVKGTFRLAFQMLGNFGPHWQVPIKLAGVRSHACSLLGQGRCICKYDFHRERIANKKQEAVFFFSCSLRKWELIQSKGQSVSLNGWSTLYSSQWLCLKEPAKDA